MKWMARSKMRYLSTALLFKVVCIKPGSFVAIVTTHIAPNYKFQAITFVCNVTPLVNKPNMIFTHKIAQDLSVSIAICLAESIWGMIYAMITVSVALTLPKLLL